MMDRMARDSKFLPGEGRLDPDHARIILVEALRGLAYLHEEHRCLHGAVKPSNLLIDHQGRYLLGDALAIPLHPSSCIADQVDLPAPWTRGASLGESDQVGPGYPSGKYVCPEMLNACFGPVGKWMDLYCLGFTVYELLMGADFPHLFVGTGPEAADPELGWLRWQGLG